MSRQRRPAQRRSATRPATPSRRDTARTSPPAAPDPVTAYREAAGYGRSVRVALLAALLLLDLSLGIRATRHDAPPALGAAGLAAMAFFFAAVFIRHLAALHRIRSTHRDLLQPSRRLILGMLQAPFGLGNPTRTALDGRILRLTVALAAALPLLIVVAGAVNR